MLQLIETINNAVNNFIWGVPAMICIFGVGLYLSLRTRFLQIRKFPYADRTTLGRMFRKRDASDGAITPFQAVCTALAATVGTGNIAGVAGAIAIGGPGAVFWMWVSALLPGRVYEICRGNHWLFSITRKTPTGNSSADRCSSSKTVSAKNGIFWPIFSLLSVY